LEFNSAIDSRKDVLLHVPDHCLKTFFFSSSSFLGVRGEGEGIELITQSQTFHIIHFFNFVGW
jgi:hypothetical protein